MARLGFRIRATAATTLAGRMGQPVSVIEKTTAVPGVVRFETNRALSGMGHDRYRSLDDILFDRPTDVLARRLFETGKVAAVHVNGSVITVELAPDATSDGLAAIVADLYTYYHEGDEPEMIGG